MLVTAIEVRPLRSLELVEVELRLGITGIVGANGSGKTNLLESLYFALSGRSFRTGDRRELIPFGGSLARAEVSLTADDGIRRRFLASVSRAEGRRHLLDDAPVDAATAARLGPPLAVFTPDRLTLIKGPPAERRAHVDRFVAARWPGRAGLRQRFGQALAQRNALLGRIGAGLAPRTELGAWDLALACAAAQLIEARAEAVAELVPGFAAAANELGLGDAASIEYAPRAEGDAEEIASALGKRHEGDLRLGRTSCGPHLDEVRASLGGRSLRRYGSQGQQRLALLALLFAEREALLAAGTAAPLMLLDDVMSELDDERRQLLGDRLETGGQALITATEISALPASARPRLIRMPAGTATAVVAA